MDQEVLEARARLAARFANGTQLGGKGKFIQTCSLISFNKLI
jgi:hypothetical protein